MFKTFSDFLHGESRNNNNNKKKQARTNFAQIDLAKANITFTNFKWLGI